MSRGTPVGSIPADSQTPNTRKKNNSPYGRIRGLFWSQEIIHGSRGKFRFIIQGKGNENETVVANGAVTWVARNDPRRSETGTKAHAAHTTPSLTNARSVHVSMSAIAGSVSLGAPASARGLGFKTSAPMGSRVAAVAPARPPSKSGRGALKVVAGNTNEGGLFAPLVVVARNIIGVKRFNQIRGKAIALHSQVRPGPRERRVTTPRAKTRRFRNRHRKRLVWIETLFSFDRERRARRPRPRLTPRAPSPPFPCFAAHTTGHLRLLQGDRRGRQGSPEPDPHGEEQRRSPRFLGLSRSAVRISGYG